MIKSSTKAREYKMHQVNIKNTAAVEEMMRNSLQYNTLHWLHASIVSTWFDIGPTRCQCILYHIYHRLREAYHFSHITHNQSTVVTQICT